MTELQNVVVDEEPEGVVDGKIFWVFNGYDYLNEQDDYGHWANNFGYEVKCSHCDRREYQLFSKRGIPTICPNCKYHAHEGIYQITHTPVINADGSKGSNYDYAPLELDD